MLDDAKLINQSFDNEYFSGPGYNSVLLSGESRSPKEACEMIKQYVVKLKENGIKREDFEIAKKEVYGDAVSSLNSVDNICNTMVDFHFNNVDIFGLIDDIAECTLEDVENRLNTMLDVNNTTLSVIIPKE
jgi:predicted Zn-dependent peptidase